MEPSQHRDLLRIRISGLSNGTHEYHFSSDPAELGLGQNFSVPVQVDASLDKTSRQMLLRAAVRTSARFECDRCVEEFELPISGAYSMLYVHNEADSGKRETAEVQVISPDAAYIDLTEDVRQMTLLSIPLKLLCDEQCKGLCPECGTNKNSGSCDCKGNEDGGQREEVSRTIEQLNKERSHAKSKTTTFEIPRR